MGKAKHALLWVEEGYLIFASEGIDGIQVERLARSIGFNKSGFYHYFGDLEGYHQELIALHEKKLQHFLLDVKGTASLDPDYLELLIRHSLMVMFQVQLLRYKNNRTFYKAGELADEKITLAIRKLWIDYMGVTEQSDLAMRYYYIVRDMFYTRISFRNFTYDFLHGLIRDARELMREIIASLVHTEIHEPPSS
jgi:AcrR family transcriptional regulator